jgi:diguanylate cyclase (GGDEF)-like protein
VSKIKAAFILYLAITAALVCAYICSVGFGVPGLGAAMSPAAAGLAGFALLYSFVKSDRKCKVNRALLLFAIGCFAWMISDILWLSFLDRGIDLLRNVPVLLGYIVTNIVIGAGTIYIGYSRFSKWMLIKNLVEALAIGVLGILFIWIVFFNKGNKAAELLTNAGVLSAGAIFISFFILIELCILFLTGLRKHVPLYVHLIRVGIFIFYASGLLYYYCQYENIYYSGSVVDVLYSFSLAIIAFGALWKTMAGGELYDLKASDEVGRSFWVCFLIFPVISVAVGGFYPVDLLVYAGVIALYHAAVKYIQLASQNEKLLEKELSLNATLEKRVSEQLRELTALANQDTVTNLYNRRYFYIILSEMIRALKDKEMLAVLQFDIDRFKTINDSYGHDVGDQVIIEISNRLTQWNTCNAVLARLGGDEFVILVRGSLPRHKLADYARQIIDICGAPICVGSQVLYLTISVGISLCPRDACDAVSLMKNTDIAMYRAKAEGYNKLVFYNSSFKDNISRKNEIEALLRNADLQTEFELVYQPQFTLPDKRLIGAEALIRWKSSEHGYIPPSVFVPVAEEINYISRIGKWVLTKAVEQIIRWNTEHALHLKMGVNISPKQLSEDDFFMTLKTLITANQFNTSWIDAEITENLMIEEKSRVKPIFDLFKELEISVSIDDFGSGYSSLGYLNKYHFDRIKIDKSLVDNLTAPGGSGIEVVKAIITMSNAVGKTIIAEGVETKEQLQILTELGCQQVQGYLLGRPVSAEEFERRFISKELAVVG